MAEITEELRVLVTAEVDKAIKNLNQLDRQTDKTTHGKGCGGCTAEIQPPENNAFRDGRGGMDEHRRYGTDVQVAFRCDQLQRVRNPVYADRASRIPKHNGRHVPRGIGRNP